MLEWLNEAAPFLGTLGGGGVAVYLVTYVHKFQRDFVKPYRETLAYERDQHKAELAEEKARSDVFKTELETERQRHRACVAEREQMRVAMRAHGVPFNPEDWNT